MGDTQKKLQLAVPWEVLIFVGSTQNYTKLVQFQQAEGVTALKLQHNCIGLSVKPC